MPRYVSLKTDRVNLREGPSKEHRTAWVFQRAGLPVEIVAEFETWRRIRDAEGTEGWVLHSLLSGRRTALVMPWAKGEVAPIPLQERAGDRTEVVARLQPGVIANVRQCTAAWCRITVPQTEDATSTAISARTACGASIRTKRWNSRGSRQWAIAAWSTDRNDCLAAYCPSLRRRRTTTSTRAIS